MKVQEVVVLRYIYYNRQELATVITNLLSAIPFIGGDIVQWIWGGFSIANPTLNRFFSLHYLLPFVIAGLAVVHLIALHEHGSNNPIGIGSSIPGCVTQSAGSWKLALSR